ncbi:AraC family transcriptional regulator [Mucilaginibacter sp.]
MKPQLVKIPYELEHSFSVRKDIAPNINNRWHYHPEVELIYFHKGAGTQFVGDHISQFTPGDVVIVGKNLPHFWKYDDCYLKEVITSEPFSTVIHFHENFIGERFLHLPETKPIKLLLEKAKRGILFKGSESTDGGEFIERVFQSKGINKITTLIECLSALAEKDRTLPLSSIGFKYDFPDSENKRITSIYSHTLSNFHKKLSLDEVSQIAGMTINSFCRYFKYHTGKTYIEFLNGIRIGYACKLLIANQTSVKQICYECGFNNFSCFHRVFKRLTGKTPQAYQDDYLS